MTYSRAMATPDAAPVPHRLTLLGPGPASRVRMVVHVVHPEVTEKCVPPRGSVVAELANLVADAPSPDAMSCALVPMGHDLTVICEQTSEQLILRVSGELDVATAPALERQLENAWANDPPALVLDLQGMTFIDSTGVKLILETHLRAITLAKRFSLRRLPRQARRVFDLVGLAGQLPIDD